MCARLLVAIAVLLVCLSCWAGWVFDGRPSTWEGIPEELQADEFTYPVLRLELGGNWTDFELKASTNNFTNLVYHVKSWAAVTNGYQDTNVWVYYTDDHATDVRAWIRATNEAAVADQLLSSNTVVRWVYVYPSHECSFEWSGWMSRLSPRLVWSYVRVDAVGAETNASGTAQSWNPVRPERWENYRTVP